MKQINETMEQEKPKIAFSIKFNEEDYAMIEKISKHLGIVGISGVVRYALRSVYNSISLSKAPADSKKD